VLRSIDPAITHPHESTATNATATSSSPQRNAGSKGTTTTTATATPSHAAANRTTDKRVGTGETLPEHLVRSVEIALWKRGKEPGIWKASSWRPAPSRRARHLPPYLGDIDGRALASENTNPASISSRSCSETASDELRSIAERERTSRVGRCHIGFRDVSLKSRPLRTLKRASALFLGEPGGR